jgi:hypothetical protein
MKTLTNTPCPHRLDRILDLPSIQLPLRQLLQILLADFSMDLISWQSSQQFPPVEKTGVEGGRLEGEVDVDTGAEGWVDSGKEVGG